MKILLSGGGTGGHITPLLAVARELKRLNPKIHIVYVGERGGKFAHLTDGQSVIDEVFAVRAGKFRRYHGESWLERLLDIKTNLLNLCDVFFLIAGIFQSLLLVRRLKPDVAFLKGGFVVAPVGLAAAIWKVPYVTHDSDALPGLANRLIAPWAAYHATALPAEFYMYPHDRTRHIGVLVGEDFRAITPELQAEYKQELGIPTDSPLLFITGGSLGARRLNEPLVDIVPKLLTDFPNLYVVHQIGKSSAGLYPSSIPRLISLEFIKDLHRYSGAADLVVTRAGATTLAELAVQGKAIIVVPNKQLTGGHQTKNADRLAKHDAIEVVHESSRKKDAQALSRVIRSLLRDEKKRQKLGQNLQAAYPADAARKLAVLLLEVKQPKKLKRKSKTKHAVEKTTRH